jgi:hypothetical protein
MKKCHCIIKHPDTQAEREKIAKALDYARLLNDRVGIILTLAQLTQVCPAHAS